MIIRMAFAASALAGAVACSPAYAETSAPIRLNQLGELPDGVKIAIMPSASAQALDWTLLSADGRIEARGKTTPFGPDSWSGENVHRIDFSGFAKTGSGFRLKVAGASSRPFAISSNIYARLPHDALEYFYHTRAGTPIEARYVGAQVARPAGHPHEVATCISGTDTHGNVWHGCRYSLDVTGGWYDAGDQGKYIVNGGIALWTLLNLYEHNSATGAAAQFRDGTEAIPEKHNGVSDLLDQARWELEFFLKMQVPQGTQLLAPVGAKRNVAGLKFVDIDASGMAHHKVADERWTPLPTRPDRDPERRVLFPPSTGATLNLAAVTAQCARIWKRIDPAFAARCLSASRRAWAAAVRNPEVYAIDSFTGSGGYGDNDLSDEFYWAAAELLTTTGEGQYRDALERSPHFRAPITNEAGWASVAPLASITLAMHPQVLGPAETKRLRGDIVAAADRFLGDVDKTGYAVPLAPPRGYSWGSNSNLLNRAMLMALADEFTGNARYRNGVIDAIDYLLGRNPLDRSFITGYGARPMQNPHHRFWAHSLDARYPSPPPGVLSGGPNNIAMADEVARSMRGSCAPQTCWADKTMAFSVNEVAINWNAPLVWVSAWIAQSEKKR
jgi:endoglucanase